MSKAATELLEAFEHLPEPDKKQLAAEIFRRSLQWDWPALADEDSIENAEQIFLELDRAESSDE
jgi:hypothetical protein